MNNHATTANTSWFSKLLLCLAGITLLTAYWPTLRWMWIRWTGENTYYSHSYLVVAVCLYLIWQRRSGLTTPSTPDGFTLGGTLITIGFIVALMSALSYIFSFSAFSLIFILLGSAYFLLGKQKAKILRFPILYLLFVTPLPSVLLVNITFRLKLLVMGLVKWFYGLFNVTLIQQGSYFLLPNGQRIMVDETCTGLRSFISLLAFGIIIAYLVKIKKLRNRILVYALVPSTAIIGNGIRVTILCFLPLMGITGKIYNAVHIILPLGLFLIMLIIITGCAQKLKQTEARKQ